MASFWFFILKLVLCLVCLAVAFNDETESVRKGATEEPLDLKQRLNRLLRDIAAAESDFDKSESATIEQGNNVGAKVESKGDGKRSKRSNNANRFNSGRRCLLGHPYDCPTAFTEFADPLLNWPTPWGWPPGPFYPEYGPNFPHVWAGHGGLFGYHHGGCGSPWRGPGCHCGCNNHGWVCCGGGGGGPTNDCPQCDDAPCKVPFLPQTPKQPGNPPLLQPLMGKQANLKAPLQVKPGKTVRRGYKRFGVPYNAGYQNTYQPNYGNYPYQSSYGNYPYQQSYGNYPYQQSYGNYPYQQSYGNYPYQQSYGNYPYQQSYGNYPYQSSYGNYPYQQSYGSDPYQSSYGTDPYQSNCGDWPCPTTQQPPSEADRVVGSLFLFKPSEVLADKKPHRKSKN